MDEAIVKSIVAFYFGSGDFNGYPIRSFMKEFNFSEPEAIAQIRNLINSRKIDCVFGNVHPNPHIKAFSDKGIEPDEQIQFLDEFDFNGNFCIYPSPEVLSKCVEVKSYGNSPFEKELALGAGQLDFRFFDLTVLEYYRNDPRYYYESDDIRGKVSIRGEFFESNSMPEHDQVILESFGFGHDKDLNRGITVLLRYLSKLTPEHQRIWEAKTLEISFRPHPEYYRNVIVGDWGKGISIFEAFVHELALINTMSEQIGKAPLFRNSYKDNRPKEFGLLLRPTLSEFNNFVLLLDKMVSDNLNQDFFAVDLDLEEDKTRPDGKIEVRRKGTLALLEEWIGKFYRPPDSKSLDHIFISFRKVRKLRQKPAHSIDEDVFDQKYIKEQRQLINEVYSGIKIIRWVFSGHPRVRSNPPTVENVLDEGPFWDR